jgi:DNA polymerase delta subunit 1
MDKLMCFVNYIEMSRVTGVPFNFLLTRGQSIKVLAQLCRRAKAEDYVIPALKGEGLLFTRLLLSDVNAQQPRD